MMYVVKMDPKNDRTWTYFNLHKSASEYARRYGSHLVPELNLTKGCS